MESGSAQASTIEQVSLQNKKPIGRPPAIVPTEQDRVRVERMAGLGMTLEMIGAALAETNGKVINKDAVARIFADEIAKGRAKAGEKISATLFERAMAGDTACLIWWSKTQLRWSPAPQEIRIQSDTRVSIASALDAAQARVIEGEAVERVVGALGGPGGDAEGGGPPDGERE